MKTNSINGFSVKGLLTKVVVAGALAGAVFMATPQKAEAQGVRIGVQFGRPYYAPVAPVVYGPAYGYGYGYDRGFYGRERREEIIRHEAWERHERFDHRRFDGYRR